LPVQRAVRSFWSVAHSPRFSSHDALLDARPAATLDLHGFGGDEARAALRTWLARQRSGTVVHVITGKGKRSPGRPVLRSVVSGMLKGELAARIADWALDAGDGGYVVRLR
jgi:DNA-nicking Smr family endonuclease